LNLTNAILIINGVKMTTVNHQLLSKVPEVTLIFWVIKILATTLGETGGDAVSMSLNLGYLIGTGIFAVTFSVAVTAQIRSMTFNPIIYWITIIATTTVGTTLADFADRSMGIGYAGGTAILLGLLLTSLFVWYRTLGTLSVASVTSLGYHYVFSNFGHCIGGLDSGHRRTWLFGRCDDLW
jgi:uncharacterized membrane-anchored protein